VGVFLHRGPVGEPGGDSLGGTLRGKSVAYLGSFLNPEDVKILGNVVLRRKPQSTFCVSVRPGFTQPCISGFLLLGP